MHASQPAPTKTQAKNVEVQHAVDDLIRAVTVYALDPRVGRVSDEEILKLRRHYNHFMFQARDCFCLVCLCIKIGCGSRPWTRLMHKTK